MPRGRSFPNRMCAQYVRLSWRCFGLKFIMSSRCCLRMEPINTLTARCNKSQKRTVMQLIFFLSPAHKCYWPPVENMHWTVYPLPPPV